MLVADIMKGEENRGGIDACAVVLCKVSELSRVQEALAYAWQQASSMRNHS